MSYSEQQWSIREKTLGDIAEGAFERHYTELGFRFERYGLNRPDVDMWKLDPFARYTPDYLLDSGNDVSLVEVQGCGRDQTFKFKDDKIDALLDWHHNVSNYVAMWLWDEIGQRFWVIGIPELCVVLDKHGRTGSFPEGKRYTAIKTEHLG